MSETETAARMIWNAFNARQGGTFEGARGTLAYDHCISIASRILTASLSRERALREALKVTPAMVSAAMLFLERSGMRAPGIGPETMEGALRAAIEPMTTA